MQYTFSGHRHSGGSPEGAMTEPLSEAELEKIITVLGEKIEGILREHATCSVAGGQLTVEQTGEGISAERFASVVSQAVADFARKRNLKY